MKHPGISFTAKFPKVITHDGIATAINYWVHWYSNEIKLIATVGLLAAAFLVAAAITVPNSAFAVQRIVGAPQSQAAAQQANNNGLAGVNAAVGVQAQVGQVCVNALNSAPSC